MWTILTSTARETLLTRVFTQDYDQDSITVIYWIKGEEWHEICIYRCSKAPGRPGANTSECSWHVKHGKTVVTHWPIIPWQWQRQAKGFRRREIYTYRIDIDISQLYTTRWQSLTVDTDLHRPPALYYTLYTIITKGVICHGVPRMHGVWRLEVETRERICDLVTGTRWTQGIVICTDVSQCPIRREDSGLDTCQCRIKSIDRGELHHWKSIDVHGDGVIVSTGSDDPSRLSMPVRDTHLATY